MGKKTTDKFEAAAERILEKASSRRRDEGEEEGLDEFDSVPQLNEAANAKDHENEGMQVAEFDIFDFCEPLVKNGQHQIQYVLKKNGEMLTTKFHPYSWERLQKEFGGGHYQISAKSLTTKKFVKHETRPVADVAGRPSRRDREEEHDDDYAPRTPQAPAAPNFMEIFSLMNAMTEKQALAAKESSRESSNVQSTMMTALVTMMQSQSQQQQSMILEMSKLTAGIAEKQNEVMQKITEKMERRQDEARRDMQEMIKEISSKKSSELGLLEILQMQQTAQDRGFKLQSNLVAIAEAKAEERMEMYNELREERAEAGAKSKSGSMTDRLIETMLPTIVSSLAAAGGGGGVASGVGTPPAQSRRPLQQRALPGAPRAQVARHPGTAQPQLRTVAAQAQGQNAQGQEGSLAQGASGRGSARGIGSAASPLGSSAPRGMTSVKIIPAASPSEDGPAEMSPTTDELYRAQATEKLVPLFTQLLLESTEPELAAKKTADFLEESGLGLEKFMEKVSLSDMMSIVTTYGLPDEANPWFEEVYAHLRNSPGVDAREHAAG